MRNFNCLIIVLFLAVLPSFAQTGITDDKIHVIFNGNHADPAIVRDGDDFYLTYSSAGKQSGLKIWQNSMVIKCVQLSIPLLCLSVS
jgi:hypothetical protein